MTGSVLRIYTASRAGEPLDGHDAAMLEAGRGIVGDRYHDGSGTFWKKLQKTADFEVTLIEKEEIDRFNAAAVEALGAGAFRRNVVSRDVRLNDLVGRRFRVGAAVLEGVRLCEPCAYLAKKLGPAVLECMVHRAGLRARILEGGLVRAGDDIVVG